MAWLLQSFFLFSHNVLATFGRFKIEESWPCGRVPRFSVFHNTEAGELNSCEKKGTLLFLAKGP